jgi:RNA polymerase sigma-70 factor (ECF subfamily)
LQKDITISNLSDEELLFSHKTSGKSIYWEELFIRYLPLLYGVCLKYLNDVRIAEDAITKLFDDLLKKIASYEIDIFRTWIYDVAKNHCLQMLQEKDYFIDIDTDDSAFEFDELMLFAGGDEEDQTALLVKCLNKLPEEQRVTLIDFFVDELSFAEIVDKTGYTLAHVKNYIRKGKRNLKLYMEKNTQ